MSAYAEERNAVLLCVFPDVVKLDLRVVVLNVVVNAEGVLFEIVAVCPTQGNAARRGSVNRRVPLVVSGHKLPLLADAMRVQEVATKTNRSACNAGRGRLIQSVGTFRLENVRPNLIEKRVASPIARWLWMRIVDVRSSEQPGV